LHGTGAKPSLNDDTTEEDFVKYLYSMALGIEEFERLITPRKEGSHVSACTVRDENS
jgi:hypothetical protein